MRKNCADSLRREGIPFLFSNLNPQNIWVIIGLICSDLALIQNLLLDSWQSLIFLTTPNHCGIISGLGAAIYQVLLLGDADWVHRYTITILFIMAAIYSLFVIYAATAFYLELSTPEFLI